MSAGGISSNLGVTSLRHPRPMKHLLPIVIFYASVANFASSALAQMNLDLSAEIARRAANKTYLDDLSVRDTAFIYRNLCIENGSLFVPSWTVPADLANSDYPASGLI